MRSFLKSTLRWIKKSFDWRKINDSATECDLPLKSMDAGAVVDDTVAVAGDAVVDVSDSAGCGTVRCDFGSDDFHLNRFVGADSFVGIG